MRSTMIWLLAILLVSGFTTASGKEQTYDPSRSGPYAVGFTSYVLTDTTRPGEDIFEHRPIPVYVWYPADKASITESTEQAMYPLDPLYGQLPDAASSYFEAYGIDPAYQGVGASIQKPFPVFMFSPGLGATPWLHISMAARLASHGFVVAVPYHFGDQAWWWEPWIGAPRAAFHRPRDVSFVLDDLFVKNATAGHPLQGAMNLERVAAGGWSFGGYAAMVLAGGDDVVCDVFWIQPPETCAPSYPDPRIKAIVPIDGSADRLWFHELARVKVPAMGIGQEWSWLEFQVSQGWMPPGFEAWQARAHAAYSGRPAYRVDVFGSDHVLFADYCEAIPALGDMGVFTADDVDFFLNVYLYGECTDTAFTPTATIHRIASQYAIAFLKTQLAGEAGYQRMLTPGWALTREPLAEFFVTEKRSAKSITVDEPGFFIYFKHQSGSDQARAAKKSPPLPETRRMTLPH